MHAKHSIWLLNDLKYFPFGILMQYFRINMNTKYEKVKSKNKVSKNVCQKPNKKQEFIKSSCSKV